MTVLKDGSPSGRKLRPCLLYPDLLSLAIIPPTNFFFFLAIGKKCWIVNFNSVILQFLLFKLGTPNCTPYLMPSREVKLSLAFNPPNGSNMSSLFRREQVSPECVGGGRAEQLCQAPTLRSWSWTSGLACHQPPSVHFLTSLFGVFGT